MGADRAVVEGIDDERHGVGMRFVCGSLFPGGRYDPEILIFENHFVDVRIALKRRRRRLRACRGRVRQSSDTYCNYGSSQHRKTLIRLD